MGNGISHCFSAPSPNPHRHHRRRRRHVTAAVTSEPSDEGLGHSFCYVSSKIPDDPKPPSYSISGASVSANPSTALSTALDPDSFSVPAAFESSARFSSIPLQPVPRFSGPLSGPLAPDRVFLSGPIERGFLSGPLDHRSTAGLFSGPLDVRPIPSNRLRRSLSQSHRAAGSVLRGLSKAIARTVGVHRTRGPKEQPSSVENISGFISVDEILDKDSNLQWAQGKAGEDRVHVVISEEHGWVFVGIYDGFNGPDATDYLLTNLYPAVQQELESLDLGEGNHAEVLKALSRALMKMEDTFLDCADMMVSENPELALMGSCVLVMLMKGDDVYLMNVGDSRAVLATEGRRDLKRINEENLNDVEGFDMDELLNLAASQLTLDHSTCVEEEVIRIRNEHPDDKLAIANDRVKGSLKVTRAFGAGFLKQPKWNDALLEMFRIDYIGTLPYITCRPSLYHHRLGAGDRFLILSSDGLYQYFTNEEAVAEVELFISTTPEGDPAQHLLEELLFRAAKKAGMDFHELLEIPQGDRRRYHDDVSVIVISLEGRTYESKANKFCLSCEHIDASIVDIDNLFIKKITNGSEQ